MRILQLCLSPGHGGLELYVARLCRLLRDRGHDCSAVVARGTMLAERLHEQGVPLYEWRVRARAAPLAAARRLARLIEREGIDVVNLHWAKDLPLAALAKRFCRRPVRLIHSRHMGITRPKRDPYHRFLYRALDRYVVLTNTMREEALRYLPLEPARVETVPLGVPAPPRLASPRAEAGPLRVGMFGRIEHEKGQHILVQAVGLLRERGVDVRAEIIGHAMDERYLEGLKAEVAARGLEDRIHFRGFHPAPMQIMPDFDVIVLATYCETFGLVLAEAMRCGVAVVGSNAGGVPEIISHAESGLLFDPGSPESLAQQLHLLHAEPETRHRLALAGQHYADEYFSERAHVARIENTFVKPYVGRAP
jgi:glycosyltransferase involved in cell wall biosynthesis